MKFQFKIQQFQTDAVDSVISVFRGQPYKERVSYIRDMGSLSFENKQFSLFTNDNRQMEIEDIASQTGYSNHPIVLSKEQLLLNINHVQTANNIKISSELLGHLGACSLDIEMETGTGKTYVYTKTIFELNKKTKGGAGPPFDVWKPHWTECDETPVKYDLSARPLCNPPTRGVIPAFQEGTWPAIED